MTSRVSPNGEWFAFMSRRSLTGYDNTDVHLGQPTEEVYLYNAVADQLVCASCNPSGVRPAGVKYKTINGHLAGGDRVWPDETWLAATIPGWTPLSLSDALHQPRYLSNGGRVFFNSAEALVPQDVNGQIDVYEHSPPASATATRRATPTANGMAAAWLSSLPVHPKANPLSWTRAKPAATCSS